MIVATVSTVPGHRVVKTLGLVRGSSIRARHIGKDILAVLRNVAGGEIREYTKMLAEAREQAVDRMLDEAETLGADAVLGVRFQTSMVMSGAAEMLSYGTAVKLELDTP
jgi:uncharacterized protein YbjQ (UPF0145 family)